MFDVGFDQLVDILSRLESRAIRVYPRQCSKLRHRRSTCTLCVDYCPVQAITWGESLQVDPDQCTGCGICAAVCSTGAISKRAEDGIVVMDQDKCIGCHYCFFACPFGIPQYGDDGTMQKCDFCLDRLEQGKEPACVATCPTKALHAGTMEELSKLAAEKAATKLAGATQPSILISK